MKFEVTPLSAIWDLGKRCKHQRAGSGLEAGICYNYIEIKFHIHTCPSVDVEKHSYPVFD